MGFGRLGFVYVLLFTSGLHGLGSAADTTQTSSALVRSATVPFHFTDNRAFVDLTLSWPHGKPRVARFWVDTGGGAFLITEALARDQGIDLSGDVTEGEGERIAAIKSLPEVRLGDMPIDMREVRSGVLLGKKTMQPGIDAEGMLPAHLLARYQVVIDYPARQFTLALPGTLKMEGVRLSTPVDAQTGFPRLEGQIGGKTYGFLLDSGAAYSMVSQAVLDEWRKANPAGKVLTGAVGFANMLGSRDTKASMMRLPEMTLGPLQLTGVGFISRPTGTFEKWMSQMMTAPIVGAIAGNVLSAFRVQIDYARGATYLEQTGQLDATDLDTVPMIIAPNEDGTYVISGVAQQGGNPLMENVQAGDKLLKIDHLAVHGKSLGEVLKALHGKPGEFRDLLLERAGKQISVSAQVMHLL